MFTANVGTPDRIIRLVLGLVLMAAPLLGGASLASTATCKSSPAIGGCASRIWSWPSGGRKATHWRLTGSR